MTNPLSRLLQERDWILADGATATNLFNMGLTPARPPEFWNAEAPVRVRGLYQAAVDAGSDLFLTNTFGGNASRLRLHNAADRVTELNRLGAQIARDIADSAGRQVIVAGSMGPTGEIMSPMGNLEHDRAVEMFHEQAQALKSGGADVLWVETFSSLEELRAVAEAALLTGMPWCASMSFEAAGRSMMGVTPAQFAAQAERLMNPPLAYGANCGVGVTDLMRSVAAFLAAGSEHPLIAKGNAGIPHVEHGHIHYDGTPELMAEYAVIARDLGVRIIGGCCGTSPEHLRAMRQALETRPRGPRPTPDAIAERLHRFDTALDQED